MYFLSFTKVFLFCDRERVLGCESVELKPGFEQRSASACRERKTSWFTSCLNICYAAGTFWGVSVGSKSKDTEVFL